MPSASLLTRGKVSTHSCSSRKGWPTHKRRSRPLRRRSPRLRASSRQPMRRRRSCSAVSRPPSERRLASRAPLPRSARR
ncbi:MAG TPA: hypothetical protein DCL01_12650 [Thauera sp.]|nr:hypothetical protein [Thauera sp.]